MRYCLVVVENRYVHAGWNVSGGRGGPPQVDAALDRILINLVQLTGGKVEMVESRDVLLQLRDAAGADEDRGHARIAERPGERHLGELLAAPFRDACQGAHVSQVGFAEHVLFERGVLPSSGVLRDAVDVAVGQQTLGER